MDDLRSIGNISTSLNDSSNSIDYNYSVEATLELKAAMHSIQAQLGRALAIVIFFIGAFGNIMLFCMCAQTKVRQRSYSYFLRALAIVDSLNLLIILFSEFVRVEPHLISNDMTCKTWQYFKEVCGTMSWWITASLSCERFLILYYPFRGRMFCQSQQVVMVIGIQLVCALGLQFHNVIETKHEEVLGCTARFNPAGRFDVLDVFVYKALGYFVPNLVIVVSNCFVLRKVDSVCVRVRYSDSRPSELQCRFLRKRSKVTIMILVITFVSVCAALPARLSHLLMYLYGEDLIVLDFALLYSFFPLLETTVMLSYSCNFYAYILFSKFRKQLKALCKGMFTNLVCTRILEEQSCKKCNRKEQGIEVHIEYNEAELQQIEANRQFWNYHYQIWLMTTPNRPLLALST